MLKLLNIVYKVLFIYKSYEPQPVTIRSLWLWINQFPFTLRIHLLLLLDKIDFITKKEVQKSLLQLNHDILARLQVDGVDIRHIIYISIDKAGSSSHVILNMLRDIANLELQGAILLDSKDTIGLNKQSAMIKTGAIIYVDDFSGSGTQFCKNRKFTSDYIIGNFSEFFMAPCICEEAVKEIKAVGVEPITSKIHNKVDRPLHPDCNSLNPNIKIEVIELTKKINPISGLGFANLATMVVLYRNAPNSLPLLFRGSLGQYPYKGIFPRMKDLPTKRIN